MVKKAIAIKKKQIKQQAILDEISDDEQETDKPLEKQKPQVNKVPQEPIQKQPAIRFNFFQQLYYIMASFAKELHDRLNYETGMYSSKHAITNLKKINPRLNETDIFPLIKFYLSISASQKKPFWAFLEIIFLTKST